MLDGPDIYDLIGNSFRMRLICFKQQEMVSWVLPFDALLQENFPQFVSETLFFLGTSGTDKWSKASVYVSFLRFFQETDIGFSTTQIIFC